MLAFVYLRAIKYFFVFVMGLNIGIASSREQGRAQALSERLCNPGPVPLQGLGRVSDCYFKDLSLAFVL